LVKEFGIVSHKRVSFCDGTTHVFFEMGLFFPMVGHKHNIQDVKYHVDKKKMQAKQRFSLHWRSPMADPIKLNNNLCNRTFQFPGNPISTDAFLLILWS
jgi:hypothetical protein